MEATLRYAVVKVAGLCSLVLFVLGCGGEDYGDPVTVTGTVTLDSQPLADAEIVFNAIEGLPADLRARRGKTDAAGKYELTDVYPAEYKVMIQKYDYAIEEAPADAGVPAKNPLSAYGSESTLRATVSAEKVQWDYDL